MNCTMTIFAQKHAVCKLFFNAFPGPVTHVGKSRVFFTWVQVMYIECTTVPRISTSLTFTTQMRDYAFACFFCFAFDSFIIAIAT